MTGCSQSDPVGGTGVRSDSTVIKVLSNRADLVSGGDALVEIVPPMAAASGLKVDVDGRDVSSDFAVRGNGRVMGLVTGLAEGTNMLTARVGATAASLQITNHSLGGPIFSGPHLIPWICSTDLSGLGASIDDKCNAPPQYSYQYWKADGSGFAAYDPAQPPSDVATTTTDEGHEVPYIVRLEQGAINRGLYQIAVLYDPSQPWAPWAPQKGWNRKLFYPFGGACNTNYNQGSFSIDVMLDPQLSRGYAVATSNLNILGQICNPVISAETVMMVKERITEQYGEIRYAIAQGGSGGAIGQLVVANAYPGLFQGLLPDATFTDVVTTGYEVLDCHLLNLYFNSTSPHLWTDSAQQTAVLGHEGVTSCLAWEALFLPVQDPTHGCSIGPGQSQQPGTTLPGASGRSPGDYDPVTNPQGCRATTQDVQVAIWGRRESDGFAKAFFNNTAVQYGLRALNDGAISVEQFLDLNEKIGGVDIDNRPSAARSALESGTDEIGYRSASINDSRQLDEVAIIDRPPTSNNEIHTPYHAFSLEARLIKAHGTADNHAMWRGGALDPAFVTMDQWLTAVEADASPATRASKILNNRPAEAVDSCFVGGEQVFDAAECDAAYPYFGSPRLAAGAPIANDIMHCARKAPARSDYAVEFTDAQWARLIAAFPEGVCDWSKPGLGQGPSQAWNTFMEGPGGVSLPPPPASTVP